MLPGRHLPVVLAVLVALAAPAGCGHRTASAPPPRPAPSTSSPAVTPDRVLAWADTVCGSLTTFVTSVSHPPTPNPADPAGTKQAYSAYLGTALVGADRFLAGLDGAGLAPVPDGLSLTADIRAVFTGLRASFSDAKTQLDAADPADPAAVARALEPLSAVPRATAPLARLVADPRLQQAALRSPSCRALRSLVPSPSPSSVPSSVPSPTR